MQYIYFSLELCYEVALGDFDMGQEELEKLAKNITTAVTLRWGKTDPSFEDSWRSVLRDAAETIGLDVKISEPEVVVNKKEEMDKLVAKLDEVSRREQIKDMELAQLRAKVGIFIILTKALARHIYTRVTHPLSSMKRSVLCLICFVIV